MDQGRYFRNKVGRRRSIRASLMRSTGRSASCRPKSTRATPLSPCSRQSKAKRPSILRAPTPKRVCACVAIATGTRYVDSSRSLNAWLAPDRRSGSRNSKWRSRRFMPRASAPRCTRSDCWTYRRSLLPTTNHHPPPLPGVVPRQSALATALSGSVLVWAVTQCLFGACLSFAAMLRRACGRARPSRRPVAPLCHSEPAQNANKELVAQVEQGALSTTSTLPGVSRASSLPALTVDHALDPDRDGGKAGVEQPEENDRSNAGRDHASAGIVPPECILPMPAPAPPRSRPAPPRPACCRAPLPALVGNARSRCGAGRVGCQRVSSGRSADGHGAAAHHPRVDARVPRLRC